MNADSPVNYKLLYNDYWQDPGRVGERSGDLARIAILAAETCGFGSALDIGCGEGFLVAELLTLGIDAFGLDISPIVVARANSRWANRFSEGSVLSIPFPDSSFDFVVSTDCLEHLAPPDVPVALREMYRVSSRYVFLQIATTQDRDDHWHLTVEGREWWEARCVEAGFRKHQLYYRANPYESLNRDNWQILILLEKVPVDALLKFDLSALVEERLLHTDMLREVGRRSDAHCIRYHKAAELIRPGDRVLDVACGLGYGSHILYGASQAKSVLGVDLSDFGIAYANAHYGRPGAVEFAVGDAQRLDLISDHSIDFIAAFETIEHVPDPITYLSELRRVLKPGGRVMLCAPNNWTDETGKDPNPHHLHVYTWERLVVECSNFFLLEEGFLQTAGGAMKCHHSDRKWVAVRPDRVPTEESEWILILGMADPVARCDVPYLETVWKLPAAPEFHVSAFARDYINPWLVKSMIAIGMRTRFTALLKDLQQRVLVSSPPESVDYGAALCGRVYCLIATSVTSAEAAREVDAEIWRYSAIPNPSPHQLRWQVSLLFAGGELARKQGRLDDAVAFFSDCVGRDVASYSPLLGNKVLDALYWLAVFSLDSHDKKASKTYLLQSVEKARQLVSGSWLNVIGDEDAPLSFGLAELAQLLDKASRAAYMLSVLDGDEVRQGIVYQESAGFFERQLIDRDRRLSEMAKAIDRLQSALLEKDARAQELAEEVIRLDAHAQALGREVGARDADAQQLAKQLAEKNARAQEFVEEVTRLDAHAQALGREVAARDADAQQFAKQLAEKDARAQELAQEVVRLDAHAQALGREVAARDADAQQLAKQLAEKDARAQELAQEVVRLDAHAQVLGREVAARDADAQQLAKQLAEKDARAQELTEEVVRLDAHAQALGQEVAARDAKAQQLVCNLNVAHEEIGALQEIIRKQDAILAYFRPRSWVEKLRKKF
ncbi:MAG: methyltransferase domain-containing protein [Nitrosomonas sp.]|nr:MAG: methyltransferase domain-containing protein [Nitrosomonas sp.]